MRFRSLFLIVAAVASFLVLPRGVRGAPAVTTVDIDTDHPGRTFDPKLAFGGGIDGGDAGTTARIFNPATLNAMKSAGLGALTYRLRTELGIEAWHWNPDGHWSDPAHQCGYWVSDATPGTPISVSYGYRLPRRGSTVDQANNDGYSRLDDGDPISFWKSNPYLDSHFTRVSDAAHPQWVVVDFARKVKLDTAKLDWGVPYATSYRLEYWDGPDYAGDNDEGNWRPFPLGALNNGHGGTVTLRLARKPIAAQFIRLYLTASSHTKPTGAQDLRDGLGYALNEVALGYTDAEGRFHDNVRHAKDPAKQTPIYVSSTDPWHRASDRDPDTEQPGLDTLIQRGLTRNLPLLAPIGGLYDTPENAIAELRYLKARGVPLRGLELGEEPDGQAVASSDYAALYAQFASAARTVDAKVPLGGPSFQSPELDFLHWPERPNPKSWLARVLDDLKAHGHADDFNFCSFEWYPFDDATGPPAPHLRDVHRQLDLVRQRFRAAGLPANFPLLMTEYGYSAFGSQAEVDLPGMLFNADSVCYFLQQGGEAAFLYGYPPDWLINEMPARRAKNPAAWGNNMLFLGDDDGRPKYRLPTYYGAWMLTTKWADPRGGLHRLLPVKLAGGASLRAYAAQRPDGSWACMLLNEDPKASAQVRLFVNGKPPGGAVAGVQYSGRQFVWHPDGENGHPLRDEPPQPLKLSSLPERLVLPPYSMTVLSGG